MSTSNLQKRVSELLSAHLAQYTIRENYRSEWLQTINGGRLELDFFIEELQVAIEVQGKQHYVYTPHFHGDYNGFRNQLNRDRAKSIACQSNNISLYEVASIDDAIKIVELLSQTKVKTEIHPNAIPFIIGTSKENQLNFRQYPKTLTKHLRRIHRILLKIETQAIKNKDLKMIKISLTAIYQYIRAKNIHLAIAELEMLNKAYELY